VETQRQLSALKDEEMKELFEAEVTDIDERIHQILSEQMPALLLPPESTDELPVLMSLNAGIGGDEATACTAILARAYQRYAELNRWDIEVISQTDGALTNRAIGLKEMTIKITAKPGGTSNVYERMRFEGGVHRFQRVPPNDSKGRIQSSTSAVIVSLCQRCLQS
jgi:peptide chain release factor 1